MSTFKRLLLLVPFLLLLVPSTALAESGPQWTITSTSRPTNISPVAKPGEDAYKVFLTNTGGASSDGTPVTISDILPAGLTLDPAGASGENPLALYQALSPAAGFSCVLSACTFSGVVVPEQTLVVSFPVDVSAGPFSSTCEVPAGAVACLTNIVRVSGGGALASAASDPTVISTELAPFGISLGSATTALSFEQAGAHPDITTSIGFNTVNARGSLAGAVKDLVTDEPPGFALDLADTPVCSATAFVVEECPIDTQVGVITVELEFQGHGAVREIVPVYNVAPNPGAVAKLGFVVLHIGIQGSISVRPGDYGGRVTFENTDQSQLELDYVSLTLWGVPSASVHDPLRGNGKPHISFHLGNPTQAPLVPYVTNPTSCGTGPLQATFSVTSWEQPNASESPPPTPMRFGPIAGCDRLGMAPSLTAEPTSDAASSATGLDVATKIPPGYENAEGLVASTLKREVVTLPEGMTVNPSSGAGLQACSEAEYAEEGVQYVPGHGCPNESRLATVRIVTPAIKEEVVGSLFLAEPAPFGEAGKNPFSSLLALYLIARIPDRGVLIKSPGLVEPNLLTGQLTTTFDGLPPLPFSLATFSFNQGANAPLVTPPACGSYRVTAALTPYSDPEGAPLEPLIPPFAITTGVGGGSCPVGGVPPFAPQVTAYPVHGNAGAYSPLYIRISRNDGEQEITGFASRFPAGLTGNLSGVEECGEAQIEAARRATGVQEEVSPSCPAGSEIGYSIAEAGVGGVLAQTPGKIYLGGPFEGAPFSVVAVTSAHVGPFDLGTVVIHFPLDINPETAAVTIPASPSDVIPHIIKGIVVHVRNIRVYVNRSNFMLNPTSCNPSTLAATVLGNGQSFNSVTVDDPFQVADCSSLRFEPKFQVSTSAKTSKANGASLRVKLAYPAGALGNDANVKQVKVELPVQLPSRLTTLQKACTQAQFKANPAGCPAPSLIGTAKAVTPILPVPLEGPVYFVSNGGEAFPNLIMVLQGDGVTIDLVGDTFISKAGITSSTFKTVPDQPVSSFELTLPEGPYSALAANGNLCSLTRTVTVKKKVTIKVHGKKKKVTRKITEAKPTSLQMPTEFVGQNGATIHQSTPVGVTGCLPARAKAKPAKQHRANRKARKK